MIESLIMGTCFGVGLQIHWGVAGVGVGLLLFGVGGALGIYLVGGGFLMSVFLVVYVGGVMILTFLAIGGDWGAGSKGYGWGVGVGVVLGLSCWVWSEPRSSGMGAGSGLSWGGLFTGIWVLLGVTLLVSGVLRMNGYARVARC